ncbi:YggT family protein [Amylolactobacillus amylophilus]|nr:YggT family protein [Amylolactobacillus amylophilus]
MLIVVYTLFTWVPALMNSRAGELLGKVVNPYLDFFRSLYTTDCWYKF